MPSCLTLLKKRQMILTGSSLKQRLGHRLCPFIKEFFVVKLLSVKIVKLFYSSETEIRMIINSMIAPLAFSDTQWECYHWLNRIDSHFKPFLLQKSSLSSTWGRVRYYSQPPWSLLRPLLSLIWDCRGHSYNTSRFKVLFYACEGSRFQATPISSCVVCSPTEDLSSVLQVCDGLPGDAKDTMPSVHCTIWCDL